MSTKIPRDREHAGGSDSPTHITPEQAQDMLKQVAQPKPRGMTPQRILFVVFTTVLYGIYVFYLFHTNFAVVVPTLVVMLGALIGYTVVRRRRGVRSNRYEGHWFRNTPVPFRIALILTAFAPSLIQPFIEGNNTLIAVVSIVLTAMFIFVADGLHEQS